jgi:hypothetical protein
MTPERRDASGGSRPILKAPLSESSDALGSALEWTRREKIRRLAMSRRVIMIPPAIGAIVLGIAAAAAVLPGSAHAIRPNRPQAQPTRQMCHFVGPAWRMYGHTGHHYYAYTYGVSCSAATHWAKKYVGKTVRPSQLRKNIPYPKYVLAGGPKGFTCYVETTPSGLGDDKRIIEGTCEKGPLPAYGEEADILFHWGGTGGS